MTCRFARCTGHIVLPFLLTLIIFGCATIGPLPPEKTSAVVDRAFDHALFDKVLETFVDKRGKVDYRALQAAPENLEAYYRRIADHSPDSHPQLFADDNHRLAYWINAYNAAVIKTVLTYYPVRSVLDVKTPALFFFLSDKAGFFFFQRLTFGGRTTSLYYLENKVIRKRFDDPRIHFALNCAAAGCPRLPRRAFMSETLDGQLDSETRRFLAEKRNFRIDHQAKIVYLSSIFKWYEKDFTAWYAKRHPDGTAGLLGYIGLYLPPQRSQALATTARRYSIRFMPYDWSLNDQHPAQ